MAVSPLLNASVEPLKVVSARRAIVLFLSGKAEILETGDESFRHEHGEVVVPAVLRLIKFVRVPYCATMPLSRKAVLARDGPRDSSRARWRSPLGQRRRRISTVQR